MSGRLHRSLLGAGVVLGLLATGVRAEDPDHRAGHPRDVACYAVPSDAGHSIGYYVGGGAPCLGDARCLDEGTWGWDYAGILPRRIVLGWFHGRRYQGGVGAYRTVGPNCTSKSSP